MEKLEIKMFENKTDTCDPHIGFQTSSIKTGCGILKLQKKIAKYFLKDFLG